MTDLQDQELERLRRRWRRVRKDLNLIDPLSESFAIGGLASRIDGLTFRMLILPPDPFAHHIEFDEKFVKEWEGMTAPLARGSLSWGSNCCATSTAAVRYDGIGGDKWNEYLSLDHSGAIDIASGRRTGFRRSPGDATETHSTGSSFLVPMFERIHAGCLIFSSFENLSSLKPPFEVTIALRATKGTHLSRFAKGWQEPGQMFSDELSICQEAGVLLRREVMDCTDNWSEHVSESLAGQIENAFGSFYGRFKPHQSK